MSPGLEWRSELARAFPEAKFDEPLSLHTTFRIGGPADCYAEPRDAEELLRLLRLARENALPVLFVGWGSNLLVRDGGVRGVVARLRGEFEAVEFPGGCRVRAGAGVRLPRLVALCAERGLGGCEFLAGVPGSVGGALVMNAGTREGDIGSLVQEVEALDFETLKIARLPAAQLHFRYRGSDLEGRVVLACLLELKPGGKGDIMMRVQRHQKNRLQTQPIHTYNVGSTFKNPPGRFAAKLIEDAGLKGTRCGGARVSELHANFIENFAHAKAEDVLELVRRVREKVKSVCGVELELEMKVVGES